MIRWILVDYGEVLSAPLQPGTIAELAELVELGADDFLDRYWRPRRSYDLGMTPLDYWSAVVGRDLSDEIALVDQLTRIDVQGWLHLNPFTLRTVLAVGQRAATQIALLSNAPEAVATAIDRRPWSGLLARCFYSCRLGHAKPDPIAFISSIAQLDAAPADVLFIDDRPENTAAAASLGFATITFTSAAKLEDEMELIVAGS